MGRDNAERLLLREGVIGAIPKSKCGNNGSKNVVLAIGDGMGWEMVSTNRELLASLVDEDRYSSRFLLTGQSRCHCEEGS